MDPDDAVADLMRASGDRLFRLAYQLCHERSGAEDIVQEALTRVYASWRRRSPDIGSTEAYARRAIVNEHLRRRRLRASTEIVTDHLPHSGVRRDVGDEVTEHDAMWRGLGELPARQRAVLVLRYYVDLPDHEIAELVGCREATVRSLAFRALEALRAGALTRELP